ncbi:hypothetical protein BG004_001087, partial [Podila humilis]
MPWRALGMLVFGVSIIFLFVRLHGDGYDFPVQVTKLRDELEFLRSPDRTFLEISNSLPSSSSSSSSSSSLLHPDTDTGSKGDPMFGRLRSWNAQRHLDKKKKDTTMEKEQEDQEESNIIEHVVNSDSTVDKEEEEEEREDNRWIWMTNVWYNDGECGAEWELMYIHKFPGPITHTSLSRRIVQQQQQHKQPHNGNDEEGEVNNNNNSNDDADQIQEQHQQQQAESIRLAVVYKVIQDEYVAYHSRIYHFGMYQQQQEEDKEEEEDHQEVDIKEDCGSMSSSTETCHRQQPFLSFDYVLPGTTPIKDFTLEHDVILYSSNEFHVMTAHVQEYRDQWDYQVAISTELTEVMTGNKKWAIVDKWNTERFPSVSHETDMIMDEVYTDGVSIQHPFVVKAVDGSSFHMPIKETIVSLENSDRPRWSSESSNQNSKNNDNDDNNNSKKNKNTKNNNPSTAFKNKWGESTIKTGPLNSIDTEQGVMNDANDIMVLKTIGNSILILKRDLLLLQEENNINNNISPISTPWRLSMIMNDELYDPTSPLAASRNVLAMRLVRAQPTAIIRAAEATLAEMMKSHQYDDNADDKGDVNK